MSLRVDEISLPADGPLGNLRLKDLSKVDLVVITGPNGAGKSMLMQPLVKPGSSSGTVDCIDEEGNRAPFTVRGKGVQQSITLISSTDLMAKFRNLKEPLALAANVTRESHLQKLLSQVRGRLDKTSEAAAAEEPTEIRMRRAAFLDADGRCGACSRTRGEYDRLGQAFAQSAGIDWTSPALTPDAERIAAESAVQPQYRELQGLSYVRPVLRSLSDLAVPADGPSSPHRARLAAESTLDAALAKATAEIPGSAAAASPPGGATKAHVDAVRIELATAREAVTRTIEAMGLLRECRRIASQWLGDSAIEPRSRTQCPVCEQSIDGDRVLEALRRDADQTDPEVTEWEDRRNRLAICDRAVESAWNSVERVREDERVDHDRRVSVLMSAADRLRPGTGWAPAVHAAAAQMHESCGRWVADHAVVPTLAAIKAAQALRDRASQLAGELDGMDQSLNAQLDNARNSFRTLQALGSLLALREELDAIPWSISLEQVESDRRRQAQRMLWVKVLDDMSMELAEQQSMASERIVDDPRVQERFDRLLNQLAQVQPRLAGLKFRGDSVKAAEEDHSDALSEGQRVLVNIAAVIAVAGKVAGAPSHLPGWIAFDEPTNGLDDASRDAVADYFGSITIDDLPSQIFITSFESRFVTRLAEQAARNGRRVRLVELPPFMPGQPVRAIEKEVE